MRLRRTHYAIAVMVVATALCADRTIAAEVAPVARPTATPGLARTLANRLTGTFRQVVRVVQPVRTVERVAIPVLAIRETASGKQTELAPLQLPLPPPYL